MTEQRKAEVFVGVRIPKDMHGRVTAKLDEMQRAAGRNVRVTQSDAVRELIMRGIECDDE